MSVIIRDAVSSDAQTILDFIIELAVYEKAEHEVKTNVEQTREAIFGDNSTVKALICEENGVAIGYAVYFYNYSTWLGKKGIYLEDLYITELKRGNGAGKKMLKHLAKKALNEKCGRFEWSCLDWNTPSREFYESLGAKSQDEWIGYRLEGKTLEDFAKS
ncbi:GNAT family N-acetyltransferase [Arcobacter roscoffensis]|uniref:GNAT family N-acetyltransferase n=1 Tax=Arcobacter roscoffensis TaxID=2961520 RepID=A0ABY5E6Q8_9BACT|nr:GNAT family N-acetyltransferase [Arcobacter roscoffensis]UTJ07552.1 GNAT family N-acetyltransferase [Arcobacter roscoffensis]